MPQIERITAWVVLLARREPLRLHREQQRLGATYRRFLLLSPDFIVDERGQAFIEEMRFDEQSGWPYIAFDAK